MTPLTCIIKWLASLTEMSVLATGRIKPTFSASEASYKRIIYEFINLFCNTLYSYYNTVSPMYSAKYLS